MKKINFKKINPFLTSINIIVILVFVNLFLNFYPFLRIDFSQNKIHSLSPITKKTIRDLKDVVNVKVFITKDLPTEIRPTANNLKTVLSEMEQTNKNRLKITYLDPSVDSKARSEAEQIGIQQLQFSSTKSDKLEVSTGYLGLSINYGDKKVVLPVAGDVGNLEYFLVSGIKRLTAKNAAKIVLSEEINNSDNQTELRYFRKFLGDNYVVDNYSFESEQEVPNDAQVLIIAGRKNKLSEKAVERIKKWVESGKSLIVFLDRINIDSAMQSNKIADTGLEQILKDNGIEVEQKLIVDESSAMANFRSSKGQFLINYPYWVQVRPENINKTIPALSGISSLTFEWASPLKLSGSAKPMFSSSPISMVDDSMTELSPVAKKDFSGDISKHVIGAINTDKIKLAVIGDVDFIKDQFVINNQQDMNLALNLVDYLSQDSSLMEIRSKTIKSSPLKAISETMKPIIRYLNIVAPIIMLTGVALITKLFRKKKNSNW